MTLAAEALIEAARLQTGLDDFGGDTFREGLVRLTDALEREAQLSALGEEILRSRLSGALTNRLRVTETFRRHPEIAEQRVEAPIFIIGLPRTGTTALSNLLHADPHIRSLRLWESSSPTPPPEKDTEDTDPRIAETEAGLALMDQAFPRMKSLYFQTPTGPTECQDLLGMEFRTSHFDGMATVPSYIRWVIDCDMTPAYAMHRKALQLLQWHCPPTLWHLKTPVHMLALPALHRAYPDARFIWTHRDPAEVMGSVCSLIAYTRSWVSDQPPKGIGAEQTHIWHTALGRAMDFRARAGGSRFADVSFRELNRDPVGTVDACYRELGIAMGDDSRAAISSWASGHRPGHAGTHEFDLAQFDLDVEGVRSDFADYLERFGELATTRPTP
ncbi:MAG TPA: sulfotransferase [Acidimicrobiales bacterium]|nr:sulfotransferase [Acidimicrobiales bacterium]